MIEWYRRWRDRRRSETWVLVPAYPGLWGEWNPAQWRRVR
jgi:hypothetical protein